MYAGISFTKHYKFRVCFLFIIILLLEINNTLFTNYPSYYWINILCPLLLFLIALMLLSSLYNDLTCFSNNLSHVVDQIIDNQPLSPLPEEETLFSKLYHQLYRLQDIMHSTTQAALERCESLQILISNISHQVKTPITNLELLLSSFKEYDLSADETEHFADMMKHQTEQINFLLDSIIKTSRLENGIISIIPVMNSIEISLLEAIEKILPQLEQKNINFNYSCDKSLNCTYDSKWTTEAFFNILENAVKYTPNAGTIKVTAVSIHGYVKITIEDTGIGISQSEYNKIFQRFYRSSYVHNKPGVGLGLYIAKEIITKQHGYIIVSSKLQKGSSFTILLPCLG